MELVAERGLPTFPAPEALAGRGGRLHSEPPGRSPPRSSSPCPPSPPRSWAPVPPPPTAADAPASSQEVGFDQQLGDTVPLDLAFRDETGKAVRLGDYFGKKPVVLSLVYYECPMLCTHRPQRPGAARSRCCPSTPGQEFEVVTVSFDPKERPELAAAKKKAYMTRYKRPGAETGWHFLTGDADSVRAPHEGGRLPLRAGTQSTKQFAHAAGIVVVTPDGRIARYLFGVEYAPQGPAPRSRRGVGGQDRQRRRPGPPLLLPLRPDDRPVQRRRS